MLTHPAVREVAVVGIPDEQLGQKVRRRQAVHLTRQYGCTSVHSPPWQHEDRTPLMTWLCQLNTHA